MADTEVRLQEISPTPGLRIPSPDAGGRAAGRPLMGPGGRLCKLIRALVGELGGGGAWIQYRPGVVQGFLTSTGLGLVFFFCDIRP